MQEYYQGVVGFQGEFLYAENLEEARLQVIGGRGFMPTEGARQKGSLNKDMVCKGCPVTAGQLFHICFSYKIAIHLPTKNMGCFNVRCPVCRNKTRLQIQTDTGLTSVQ